MGLSQGLERWIKKAMRKATKRCLRCACITFALAVKARGTNILSEAVRASQCVGRSFRVEPMLLTSSLDLVCHRLGQAYMPSHHYRLSRDLVESGYHCSRYEL